MRSILQLLIAAVLLNVAAAPATAAPAGKPKTSVQTALFAGGCFWGMEEVFRKIPGVIETSVGYSGGKETSPTYDQVSSGTTGHAETLQLRFDPAKISYETLVKLFFRAHDPTTLNRQGNDVGTQYRSAIFYANASQKREAEKVIQLVNASKKWGRPVVTELTEAAPFFPAESYHQKYLVKKPDGYNDHYLRDFEF